MNNETELCLILWEKIKEFIPANKREDAAIQMLDTITDFLDEVKIDALLGEDEVLDSAIKIINEDSDSDEEEDYSDEWEV